MSEITIKFKDRYTKPDFPNIYDELRRKISDVQSKMPPGAGPSLVDDDWLARLREAADRFVAVGDRYQEAECLVLAGELLDRADTEHPNSALAAARARSNPDPSPGRRRSSPSPSRSQRSVPSPASRCGPTP